MDGALSVTAKKSSGLCRQVRDEHSSLSVAIKQPIEKQSSVVGGSWRGKSLREAQNVR
jgi:hypothetical protein